MTKGKSRILIVEDDPDIRKMLSWWLEKAGFEIITADNGKIGLEKAIEERPAAIVSDIRMPVMDGFQFCREVRLDKRTQFTPFILYSAAYIGEDDERLANEVGADLYLRKPIGREQFLNSIQDKLKEYKDKKSKSIISDVSEEDVFYQKYNKALVQKLENRNIQLEEENQKLKKSLRSTKKSLEKYKVFFEMLSDAVLVYDLNINIIIEVNKAAEDLYGYTEEEFLEIFPKNLIHEGNIEDIISYDSKKLKKGVIIQQIHKKKDGATFPVEISLSLINIDTQGLIIQIVRDVSYRENKTNES